MTGTAAQTSRAADILAAHRQFLFPAVTPYYDEPIVLESGSGSWVRDMDGREYLDAFSGILTTSLGHCHARLVTAVRGQLGRLGHSSTLYVTEPQVEGARRLAALTPGALNRSFFTNSGTEAVETALSLARVYTGRSEVIALRGAYHGRTALAAGVTAQSSWRPLPSMQAGIVHTVAPYPYRCPFRQPCDEQCAETFARDLEEVILTVTNGRPAAFIVEAVQGLNGVIIPPLGYLQRAAEVIRSYGGLFVVDEVQTGFGRTGGKWFGIEHWDVVPDIMTVAKGVAAGLPAAATMTTDEIAGSWRGKTISTFGGNPLSMAGMVAALDVMVEEDVPTLAASRGARLHAGLQDLGRRHRWIGEVRGMGLMQALELVEDPASRTPDPRRAGALLEAAKAEGLLVGLAGLHGQVVRLGPNLLISESEVDEALERLGRACWRID